MAGRRRKLMMPFYSWNIYGTCRNKEGEGMFSSHVGGVGSQKGSIFYGKHLTPLDTMLFAMEEEPYNMQLEKMRAVFFLFSFILNGYLCYKTITS